jgi:hypothetical protein
MGAEASPRELCKEAIYSTAHKREQLGGLVIRLQKPTADRKAGERNTRFEKLEHATVSTAHRRDPLGGLVLRVQKPTAAQKAEERNTHFDKLEHATVMGELWRGRKSKVCHLRNQVQSIATLRDKELEWLVLKPLITTTEPWQLDVNMLVPQLTSMGQLGVTHALRMTDTKKWVQKVHCLMVLITILCTQRPLERELCLYHKGLYLLMLRQKIVLLYPCCQHLVHRL